MHKIIKLLLALSVMAFYSACGGEDDKPKPGNGTDSKAKPVYNQAYQENFEEDKIDEIIANAKNAYVIVDPFLLAQVLV